MGLKVFPFPKALYGAVLGLSLGGGCWGLSSAVLLVQHCAFSRCSHVLAAAKGEGERNHRLSLQHQVGKSNPLLPLAPRPFPTHLIPPMGGCPGTPQWGWMDPALKPVWRHRAFPRAGGGSGH